MNKRMQKLLSVFTAGLFVLQSASLVATGVFAEDAGTAEVVKHTPTLDAKLDDQYKKSYKTELDTSVLRLRKTGKPSVDGVEEWPVYTAEDRTHMVIDENEWIVKHDMRAKDDAVFRPMYSVLLND